MLDALQMRNEDAGLRKICVRRRLAGWWNRQNTGAGMENFRGYSQVCQQHRKVSERSGSLPDNLIQLRDYLNGWIKLEGL